MKADIIKHFTFLNEAISESNQEDIEEFIKIFASNFKPNWKHDNVLIVRNRHNKTGGASLMIEFKSKLVADVNPNQCILNFKAEEIQEEEEESSEDSKESKLKEVKK